MPDFVALFLELALELLGRESEGGQVGGEGFELVVKRVGGLGEDGSGRWCEMGEKVLLRRET